MLSIPKLAALGTLSLATLATAAPTQLDSNALVARGDKKGDYHYYDYDKDDFKDVKVEVIIVEVKKKGTSIRLHVPLPHASRALCLD